MGGIGNVHYCGRINRKEVDELYRKSIVGLCFLLPTANYINSQPIKIFEYMVAGLPVIASDFPAWNKYILDIEAGIPVSVEDPKNIGKATQYLWDNRDKAMQMGQNGRRAVIAKYSWEVEEKELIKAYYEIMEM